MKPTQLLNELGQRIWLDNITRGLITSGTLRRYIHDFSVTGLTSNPTIFDHAIGETNAYDAAIQLNARRRVLGEALFLELAFEDLRNAADLFQPTFEASAGEDGWVSMEVSPLLARDTKKTVERVAFLHDHANRPNFFIKIPGTPEGVPAIEESIFAGIPINVTLLFSREQYLASAKAYIRGIERRVEAGLSPRVPSVASLFVSRWDKAVAKQAPPELHDRLGIAVELHDSPRWLRLAAAGARTQRLLWASTGTKDPGASDVLYVQALVAPETITTMPDATLKAFAEHGRVEHVLSRSDENAETVLDRFAEVGVDIDALAERLQQEGIEAFTTSWNELMSRIDSKVHALEGAAGPAHS
jgi:transaldolase